MELWNVLETLKSDRFRWVDLSYPVSPQTPHYEGFRDLQVNEVMSFGKEKVCAREYTMVSQYGTHVDPPFHFVQEGRALHRIGVEEMAYPLCVIDVSEKAAANPDFGMTVEDIREWEAEHGPVPAECFVAMRTDWYKREGEAFLNKDEKGDCHYPGWTQPALEYLCETRKIAAIGHEPPDTDPAVSSKTALWAGELYYLKQGKYQIEMLRQLDLLPAKGAIIFCTWPNIMDAPGFTARCFAVAPK